MKKLLKKRFSTIHIYLVKEFLFSFSVSFLFFFMLFFVNQVLLLAEKILQSRIPLSFVLRLIICTFPSILALSFPFATLVGALMSLGSLSSTNEILAMESVGYSLKKISAPYLLVAVVFCFISFYINDYLIPLGAFHYKKISREIFSSTPSLELEPYSRRFIDNRVIITSSVDDNKFGPILVIDKGQTNETSIIIAPSGEFQNDPNQLGSFSIVLDEVTQHTTDRRKKLKQTYTTADMMSLNFLFSSLEGSSGVNPQEKRSLDLYFDIKEMEVSYQLELDQWSSRLERAQQNLYGSYGSLIGAVNKNERNKEEEDLLDYLKQVQSLEESKPRNRNLDRWKMEFYQKYAIPFSCFPFVLLAFPLGIVSRRSGRAVGFFVGLILSFLYWAFLIVGRNLTLKSGVSPFLSIWLANILLLITGLVLYIKQMRGQK